MLLLPTQAFWIYRDRGVIMSRKRIASASLVLLLVAIGSSPHARPAWATSTVDAPVRSDFTATLSGPDGNNHLCLGSEYTWSVSATGGTTPYTYDWEVGGTYTGDHTTSQSYTFSSEGWYRVNVDVYDATTARRTPFVYVYVEDGGSCVLP